MPIFPASHPDLPGLVTELQIARTGDHRTRSNRLFSRLVELLEPVIRRIAGRYSRARGHADLALRQNCLICLDDCVNRFTATLAVKVDFERYFGTRLNQHLAREYRREQSLLSGFSLKLIRKISALLTSARAHGVDTTDPQAILDHAVSAGHRRSILRKYIPLTAPTLHFDGPGPFKSECLMIDFPASFAPETTETPDAELARRVLSIIPTLPDSQRRVVTRLFGLDGEAPASLVAIARAEGVTSGSIAERRDRALLRLRAQSLNAPVIRCAA